MIDYSNIKNSYIAALHVGLISVSSCGSKLPVRCITESGRSRRSITRPCRLSSGYWMNGKSECEMEERCFRFTSGDGRRKKAFLFSVLICLCIFSDIRTAEHDA